MKKAMIGRCRPLLDKGVVELEPVRIGDPDELRRGEILDYGLNAPSPLGTVDWFIVQREDGCFYLSYTTIPRDVAAEKHGQALIDSEFPGMSRIPLVIETVLNDFQDNGAITKGLMEAAQALAAIGTP